MDELHKNPAHGTCACVCRVPAGPVSCTVMCIGRQALTPPPLWYGAGEGNEGYDETRGLRGSIGDAGGRHTDAGEAESGIRREGCPACPHRVPPAPFVADPLQHHRRVRARALQRHTTCTCLNMPSDASIAWCGFSKKTSTVSPSSLSMMPCRDVTSGTTPASQALRWTMLSWGLRYEATCQRGGWGVGGGMSWGHRPFGRAVVSPAAQPVTRAPQTQGTRAQRSPATPHHATLRTGFTTPWQGSSGWLYHALWGGGGVNEGPAPAGRPTHPMS